MFGTINLLLVIVKLLMFLLQQSRFQTMSDSILSKNILLLVLHINGILLLSCDYIVSLNGEYVPTAFFHLKGIQ